MSRAQQISLIVLAALCALLCIVVGGTLIWTRLPAEPAPIEVAPGIIAQPLPPSQLSTGARSRRCALSPALPDGPADLEDDTLPGIPEVVRLSGGELEMIATRPQGTGTLEIAGFEPIKISWDGEHCTPDPIMLVPQ